MEMSNKELKELRELKELKTIVFVAETGQTEYCPLTSAAESGSLPLTSYNYHT